MIVIRQLSLMDDNDKNVKMWFRVTRLKLKNFYDCDLQRQALDQSGVTFQKTTTFQRLLTLSSCMLTTQTSFMHKYIMKVGTFRECSFCLKGTGPSIYSATLTSHSTPVVIKLSVLSDLSDICPFGPIPKALLQDQMSNRSLKSLLYNIDHKTINIAPTGKYYLSMDLSDGVEYEFSIYCNMGLS